MGQLELFSLEDEVSRKLKAGSLSLTLQIFKLHGSPPKITNQIDIKKAFFRKKDWDSIHAINPSLRKIDRKIGSSFGHPSMPAIHDHPLSSVHAINHPMTAIHEEKGMGIQLPSVKVREVGPAWNPRLCQPSVRQVLKNHFGQFKKG